MASRRRGMIVGLSKGDHGASDISRILGITRTTCQSVINNFCEKGSQMLLLVLGDHLFYLIVKSTLLYVKPEKIERILPKKLLNILTNLILPIWPDVCYINMIILERVSRDNRLKWCQARKSWNKVWDYIIWSDESRFLLFENDEQQWVWCKPHENYDVDGLVPTAKSGNDGVMIWGCFVKNKLGL